MPVKFRFDPMELHTGLSAITRKAMNPDPAHNYVPLAEQAMAALDPNTELACDVVATQMLIDGTLATVRLPQVWDRLPNEIADRDAVVGSISQKLGTIVAKSGTFLSGIAQHTGALGRSLTRGDVTNLQNAEHMSSLGGAAFSDARLVIGGAHRVLRRLPLTEPITPVIQRSTSLPAEISRASTKRMPWVVSRLGFPYILPRYLPTFTNQARLTEVTFAGDARMVIDRAADPERGCPAGRIRDPSGPGTVLTRAWVDIVAVLAPENATSTERNRKVPA